MALRARRWSFTSPSGMTNTSHPDNVLPARTIDPFHPVAVRAKAISIDNPQSKTISSTIRASVVYGADTNKSSTVTAKSSSPGHPSTLLAHANSEIEECVICLDNLELGRALFTAECGHRFHFACLLENVNHDELNADKCPICRKPQTQWPEQTKGLVRAHPYCTSCGKRGTGGTECDRCHTSLAHTPTSADRSRMAAAERARRAAEASAQRQPTSGTTGLGASVVVECPTCRIRCLVNTSARGTLQCPNGHLFQLRLPPGTSIPPASALTGGPDSSVTPPQPRPPLPPHQPIMRQCPTCYTRVQMPPGAQAGQYMCPRRHTFYFSPFL